MGATALVASFPLPWVRVDAGERARFAEEVRGRLQDPLRPGLDDAEDWEALASIVAGGEITGVDVFYWARVASRAPKDVRGRAADGPPGPAPRAVRVLAIWLAIVPLLAVALVVHAVMGRLGRPRGAALVLAMLAGASGLALVALHQLVEGTIDRETDPAEGLHLLLAGSALTFLAGAFGVRVRNWWQVYSTTLLLGGGIAALAWSYVQWGITS